MSLARLGAIPYQIICMRGCVVHHSKDRPPMSASGPGCVKTRLRITSIQRKAAIGVALESAATPHARMAASNGSTPRIFSTRVRL